MRHPSTTPDPCPSPRVRGARLASTNGGAEAGAGHSSRWPVNAIVHLGNSTGPPFPILVSGIAVMGARTRPHTWDGSLLGSVSGLDETAQD